MSIIKTTLDRLNSDPELVDALPGGIYTTWSVKGKMPRLILGFEFSPAGSYDFRTGVVTVDLFSAGNEVDTLESLALKVRELLNDFNAYSEESGATLRYYLNNDGLIPEPDDKYAHWNLTFNLRFLNRNRPAARG